MIDTSKETPISLSDAANLLPSRRAGKKTHPSTLYRWATHGYKKIRLEVIRIGATLCTSQEALQRFYERTTEADPCLRQTDRVAKSINKKSQRDIEQQLDDFGLG